MQNYRNILTYTDFQLIVSFFEEIELKDFQKKTATVMKYLKQSYKEAQADGFKDCKNFDIEEYIAYLDALNWMAVNTGIYRNESMVLTNDTNTVKINVLPWAEFMSDNGGIKTILITLSVMKGVVVNYSNQRNTALTKEIYCFIESLEVLLEEILDNHAELN